MQYSNDRLGAGRSPSVSNDRLQKAIERNRAKVLKRNGVQSTEPPGPPPRGVPLSKMQSMSARREARRPATASLPRKISSTSAKPISRW